MLNCRLYNGEPNHVTSLNHAGLERASRGCQNRLMCITPLALLLIAGLTWNPASAEDASSIAELLAQNTPGELGGPATTIALPSAGQVLEETLALPAPSQDTQPPMVSVETLSAPAQPPALREPAPTAPQTTEPWLDIRPRSLGPDRELIDSSRLPSDTSQLQHADPIATWNQTYRVDYALSDFIRGASFYHRPLHFEDPYLERYGRTIKCTKRWPAAHSSFHMLWKTSSFPISLTLDPPWQRHRSGFREPYLNRRLKR
ncbi:MAG: hypothetical protein AAFX06_19440 [Planctomycetota bacterium]